MRLNNLSADVAFRTGVRTFVQMMLLASLATNLLLAFAVATADRTHRETLIPPAINKSFWVDDRGASGEYIEQMGLFLLQLSLNNTPVSAEYNARLLLKYASPSSYGELERAMLTLAKQLKDSNASTVFSVRNVTVSEKTQAVAFGGVLTTYIADKRVSEISKTYLVRFANSAGRAFVSELRETDPKQPFSEQQGSGQ